MDEGSFLVGGTAAEGEGVVAIRRIHIDTRRVEGETIGAGRRIGCTRPVITLVVDAIHVATIQMHIPTTDKSQW